MSDVPIRQRIALIAVAVAAIVLLVGIVASCGGSTATTTTAPSSSGSTTASTGATGSTAASSVDPGKVIKIGALGDYSGGLAGTGDFFKRGIEVALAEANNEVAGHKVELIMEDSGSTVEMAVEKAKKLVEKDHVDVVIGPFVGNMYSGVRTYLESKNMISMSYFEIPYDQAQKMNSVAMCGTTQGAFVPSGDYAVKKLGAKTVMMLTSEDDASQQAADGYEAGAKDAGAEVLPRINYSAGAMDFGPYLAQIAQKKPDVLGVFFFEFSTALRFFQQLQTYGLGDQKVIVLGGDVIEPVMKDMGDYVLGVYGALQYTVSLTTDDSAQAEANKTYTAAFMKMFPDAGPPMVWDVDAYMATKVFLTAVEKTGGDTAYDKVWPAIIAEDLVTPKGSVHFTDQGIALWDTYMMRAKKLDSGEYQWEVTDTFKNVGLPAGVSVPQ